MSVPDDPKHRITAEPEGNKFRGVCTCGWKSSELYDRKWDAVGSYKEHFKDFPEIEKGTKPVSIEGKWSEVGGHKVHKIDGSGKV